MSVLIKGMEMPTDPFYPIHATIYADGTVITGHGIGEFAKEAVSVPTPHGKLIDMDELLYSVGWLIPVESIEAVPTVIEAEE